MATIKVHQEALAIFRRIGDRRGEADALEKLGELQLRHGVTEENVALLRQSLEIYLQLGMPHATQLAARLAELGFEERSSRQP